VTNAPRTEVPRPTVQVSDVDVAFWECTALDLEDTGREIAKNVMGPRAEQRARVSNCSAPYQAPDLSFVGVLPTPANDGLAKLNVAELVRRAATLDRSMRIRLENYGGVEIESPERSALQLHVREAQAWARPAMAAELDERLGMASELALRLAPLGRNFARAHAATQLVHSKLASLALDAFYGSEFHGQMSSETYLRIATSARRIERVAAAMTALLSITEGGLESHVTDRTMLETAYRVRVALARPADVSEDAVLFERDLFAARMQRNPRWIRAFSHVPDAPITPPRLVDIADAADVRSDDNAVFRDIDQGDYRVVPEALVTALPEGSAPHASALSVRAVLDGQFDVALCQARALLREQSDLAVLMREIQGIVAVERDGRTTRNTCG
jgi:hypothetical protein